MAFYKVIVGNTIVGVGTGNGFRYWQVKHACLMLANSDSVQFMDCNGTLYRDAWMHPLETEAVAYTDATVARIDEAEYDDLYTQLVDNSVVEVFEEVDEVDTEEETETLTVAKGKALLLAEENAAKIDYLAMMLDVDLGD